MHVVIDILFFQSAATPPEYRSAGVCAGAHTREVMGELGYREDEIDEFEKTGLFS